MPEPWRIALQVVFYTAFAAVIAYYSQQPAYQHLHPEQALIKLSISHAGQHREECRRRTQEELEQLAPNMRRPLVCNRERVPLLIEVVVDGDVIYRDTLPPSGLSKDGESTVYKRFVIDSGRHMITARLRDSRRQEGFDYERSTAVTLAPQQNFVIDFKVDTGGFIFL